MPQQLARKLKAISCHVNAKIQKRTRMNQRYSLILIVYLLYNRAGNDVSKCVCLLVGSDMMDASQEESIELDFQKTDVSTERRLGENNGVSSRRRRRRRTKKSRRRKKSKRRRNWEVRSAGRV